MITIVLAVTGILFVMVPHFILPMEMLSGGRGAWLLSECSFWFHPEWICGALLAAAVASRMRGGRGLVPGAAAVVLGLAQAAVMRPLSFYLASEENLVILGQTYSLRSHAQIREVLAGLALVAAAALVADLLLARRRRTRVSLTHLAASNIGRKLFRSVSLVMALSVVIGAFFADVLLTDSIGNTLELGAGRLGADLVVVPKKAEKEAGDLLINGTPHVFNLRPGVLDTLKGWKGIEKISPQLFFRPFSYLVCCTTEQVLMVGYDPETDFTIAPWVNYFLHQEQADDELVVGARVKFYPGQKVSLFGKLLSVIATLDHTGIGYFDRSAFMPMEGARKLIRHLEAAEKDNRLHKRRNIDDLSLTHLYAPTSEQEKEMKKIDARGISAIFIKCADGVDVKKMAERITREIPSTAVINVRAATVTVKRQLTAMLDALLPPIVILMMMGTVILAVVFSMSANERRREVGLLRAMGARRRDIFNLFLGEAVMISIMGGVFGVLGGGSLMILFRHRIMASLKLLYIWPSAAAVTQVALLTLAASVFIGIVAGLAPALRAARQDPYEAFRDA